MYRMHAYEYVRKNFRSTIRHYEKNNAGFALFVCPQVKETRHLPVPVTPVRPVDLCLHPSRPLAQGSAVRHRARFAVRTSLIYRRI